MGFVGWWKAGSERSTSAWVTIVATGRFRAARHPPSAAVIRWPTCPCVIAPRTNSGCGGTSLAPSSCWMARLPTWGPLPWVRTTRWPSWTRSHSTVAMPAMLASCCAYVPRPPSWRMALPPPALLSRGAHGHPQRAGGPVARVAPPVGTVGPEVQGVAGAAGEFFPADPEDEHALQQQHELLARVLHLLWAAVGSWVHLGHSAGQVE